MMQSLGESCAGEERDPDDLWVRMSHDFDQDLVVCKYLGK